jgi:hypothetical protein
MGAHTLALLAGLSPSGALHIVKVGDDGEINGGDIAVNVDAHPHKVLVFCGMTTTGDIVPFKVNANGILSYR